MDGGTELRLFDPRRNPQDWTDLIRPTECAVFLKDRTTTASVAPDGRPYPDPAEIACMVFGCLDAAERFSAARVQALPHLRCEIYDAQGLANPPLLVIVHPDHQGGEDSDSRRSGPRKLIAGGLLAASVPLLWTGWSKSSDLAVFLAINCIFVALRLVYWDFGLKQRERERRRRLEEHRKMERGMSEAACKQAATASK